MSARFFNVFQLSFKIKTSYQNSSFTKLCIFTITSTKSNKIGENVIMKSWELKLFLKNGLIKSGQYCICIGKTGICSFDLEFFVSLYSITRKFFKSLVLWISNYGELTVVCLVASKNLATAPIDYKISIRHVFNCRILQSCMESTVCHTRRTNEICWKILLYWLNFLSHHR